jgi:hypothetical protein
MSGSTIVVQSSESTWKKEESGDGRFHSFYRYDQIEDRASGLVCWGADGASSDKLQVTALVGGMSQVELHFRDKG